MGELLVIFSCINNAGCSETSSLYFDQHPGVQEFIKKEERIAKDMAGPVITEYFAPFIAYATGRAGTIGLYRYVYLNISCDKQELMFKKEF